MGNLFKSSSKIEEFQSNKNMYPIEESTQTCTTQSMQSNRYATSIPYETISKPVVETLTPVSFQETKEPFEKKIKPKNYNETLRRKYALGMHHKDEMFIYNFWVPEGNMAIKDFIEVHSIPVYELQTKMNFYRYCNEEGWFNTAIKFKTVWESIHQNTSRLICGIKSKFDIIVDISDSFYDTDGTVMRAYSIKGGDEIAVSKAFSHISETWRSPFHRDTKWHHDMMFSGHFTTVNKVRKKDSCGDMFSNIIVDSEFDIIDENNANFNENNRQTFPSIGNFNSNLHYVFLTIPKNDRFNLELFNEDKFNCQISRDNCFTNQRYDVIIINGKSRDLETLKIKLHKYLKKRYKSKEKYIKL